MIRAKLFEIMEKHGWTQRRLAKECGVTESAVSQWLKARGTGTPGDPALQKLAALIGVPWRVLAGYEDRVQPDEIQPVSPWPRQAPILDRALKVEGVGNKELAAEMAVSEDKVKQFRRGNDVPNADQLALMVRQARVSADEVLGIQSNESIVSRIVRQTAENPALAIEVAVAVLRQLRESVRSAQPSQIIELLTEAGDLAVREADLAREERQSLDPKGDGNGTR